MTASRSIAVADPACFTLLVLLRLVNAQNTIYVFHPLSLEITSEVINFTI